jgi:Tetratricopeptide repeat
MRKIFLLILFIAFTSTQYSQSKLDSLITIGNEQSFQFQFNEAELTFEFVISEYPNSPLGYYFLSRNYLWFYLANKDSISHQNYLKYFEAAKIKGELEYDNNSDDPVVNYNLGNIYLLNSIYSSAEQNSMDAFWSTKSAVNYFEDAIELDADYYEPYLPLGTIKYALGFVPGFLGWAISLAGLEGEKYEGLKNIRNAFENCVSCKTEAAYHLGKIYTEYTAMYGVAEEFLSQIVEDYPNNELFLYQYAILQIDRKELVKAEEILNRLVIQNSAPKFYQTYALSLFLKGEIYFKQNKFKEAIAEYEHFISKTTTPDYTGIANFKIALSYEMLSEKLLAQKYFILARLGNQNIAEDIDANEQSQKFFDSGLSENDKLLINARNNFESGNYSKSIETLNKIETNNIGSELEFNINIFKIEAYQHLDKLINSSKIIEKYVDNNEIPELNEFAKFSYLKAVQNFREENYSEANNNLNLAFDNIEKDNNKLQRLLINLAMKLEKNNE